MQELQIGDKSQTLAGRKTIKWIGYNNWPCQCTSLRSLCSPLHCIFFNEALIPSDVSDQRGQHRTGHACSVSAIEYYHIDLDTHDVIYAEGACIKSFFDDCSNR